uniref:Uncharacterized protein n=1 Tax=Arundo donax TaxID=35708 RepID=A0A0A9DPZ6_ARUDO
MTHKLSHEESGYHSVHSILIYAQRSLVSSEILKSLCFLQCTHQSFSLPTHPSKWSYQRR